MMRTKSGDWRGDMGVWECSLQQGYMISDLVNRETKEKGGNQKKNRDKPGKIDIDTVTRNAPCQSY